MEAVPWAGKEFLPKYLGAFLMMVLCEQTEPLKEFRKRAEAVAGLCMSGDLAKGLGCGLEISAQKVEVPKKVACIVRLAGLCRFI